MKRPRFQFAAATLFCWAALSAPALAQRVESLPAPGPGKDVIDHARIIQPFALDQLEVLCQKIREFNRSQLVVLTVQDTRGMDPERYATAYFNRHGIGDRQNNNGLLVFLAMKQRSAWVIPGDGLRNARNLQLCEEIARDVMVARMKRNDPAGAMFGGGAAAASQILGFTDLAEQLEQEFETNDQRRDRRSRQRTRSNQNRNSERGSIFWWLAGGGVLGVGFVTFLYSRYQVRYGKRDCKECSTEMVLLDEQKDDSFLNDAERIEERIGSVDYDVWACLGCDHVLKYRYGRWLTRYSKCPKCRYKTRSRISKTIRAATTRRGGKVRVREDCENCNYHKTYTYSTPKLPKPSKPTGSKRSNGRRGGGGGFSFGSSRRGGWGGGGSSSRGGGFSSGGGGARW